MPRLTSYIIILLALVSFAQAGPFGLKNGMTVDEIIEAGFESDWQQVLKLDRKAGISYTVPYSVKLTDILTGKPKTLFNRYVTFVLNKKHKQKYFELLIDKEFGLTEFGIFMMPEDKASLDNLADDYKKKIASKYQGKITQLVRENEKPYMKRGVNMFAMDIIKPKESDIILEIYVQREFNKSDNFFRLSLRYIFPNADLWDKRQSKIREKEKQEKLKDLLPKDEDL